MSKPDPESRDLGKTVSDLVEEALERYLRDEDQSDAADGAAP